MALRFGKYRIIAELGNGGMAQVYLAFSAGPRGSGFAKLAVVKRLRKNLTEEPEFVAMLLDEARIAARLNHPNVVQTFEAGSVSEEYFIAMEYLDGQPLHRIQRRAARDGKPLEPELSYAIVHDALAGLHHAHELKDYDGSDLGIVHRDVTPQNVIVTYDGQVKVVDFGIAKAAGRSAETRQGIVKGKVRYMAPEQALGMPVDRRADVFVMGILLWEAATGKRFWDKDDDFTIIQSLISGNLRASPRALDATVPEEIDAICTRALAADPEQRYATAEEMRTALDTLLGVRLIAARRELGPRVASLFETERQHLRGIIERAGRDSVDLRRSFDVGGLEDEESQLSAVVRPATTSNPPNPRSDTPENELRTMHPAVMPRAAAVPRNAARPPPDTPAEPTTIGLVGMIPRSKRFGAGLVFGSATMLAATLVAIAALHFVVEPSRYGDAPGPAREQVDERPVRPLRRQVVEAPVDQETLPAPTAVAPSATDDDEVPPQAQPPARPAFRSRATPPRRSVASTTTDAAPTTRVEAAPAATPSAPREVQSGHRRLRPIDPSDPWGSDRSHDL